MEQKPYIITGMPRSGTTLISRILDAHPNSIAPPDPYFGFFREFRNALFEELGIDYNKEEPLHDYFYGNNTHKKHAIMNAKLEIPLNRNLDNIKDTINSFAETSSPLVIPYVKKIEADDYKSLLLALYRALKNAYGDNSTTHIGFKTAWIEEFFHPLYQSLNEMKFVQIIRDPRSLIASRLKSTQNLRHDYPLDFLVKNWRKSVLYGMYNAKYYSDNVYVVKYEDLVTNTKEEVKKICRFLELEYNEKMVDISSFRDGKGNTWTNNSAYKDTNTISSDFINKWMDVLTANEVQYIEDLCNFEMMYYGYNRITKNNIQRSAFQSLNKDSHESDWINQMDKPIQMSEAELLKYHVYNDPELDKYSNEFLEKLFLFPEIPDIADEPKVR
ncbi:sulfotransferase [Gracilibacillus sp. YIM 98692]|uniref:sulfotransferase family protein n=1 Tax=Gracilibacillus sp. YIM 98692 TaxID=2663532 RepID=UPI0013D19F10|nr:sulfotransferase [Gracilibacillus sp. YIM 98692]